MIEQINGNLIAMIGQPEVQAIAHGCNCFCKMGAGFALSLVTTVPEVLTADLLTTPGDIRKLGNYSHVRVGNIDYYNLYTQLNYGRRQVNFDIMAFRTALMNVIKHLIELGKTSIHIPHIGAGLGGGEWDTIFAEIFMIDQTLCKDKFTICIVNYTG